MLLGRNCLHWFLFVENCSAYSVDVCDKKEQCRNPPLPLLLSIFKLHSFGSKPSTVELCVVLTTDYLNGMENEERGAQETTRLLESAKGLVPQQSKELGNCWCSQSSS